MKPDHAKRYRAYKSKFRDDIRVIADYKKRRFCIYYAETDTVTPWKKIKTKDDKNNYMGIFMKHPEKCNYNYRFIGYATIEDLFLLNL